MSNGSDTGSGFGSESLKMKRIRMDPDPQHCLPVLFLCYCFVNYNIGIFKNCVFIIIQTGWREKLKSYPEIMADMFEAMTRQANQQLFCLFTLPYWRKSTNRCSDFQLLVFTFAYRRKLDQSLFRFSTF
jgi:hypothetical protein